MTIMSDAATMNELELTLNRRFAASRERVFKAWLEPRTLAKFMKPTDLDHLDAVVETDPVKGGRFSILMKMETMEIPMKGLISKSTPIRACSSPGNRPIRWPTAS